MQGGGRARDSALAALSNLSLSEEWTSAILLSPEAFGAIVSELSSSG